MYRPNFLGFQGIILKVGNFLSFYCPVYTVVLLILLVNIIIFRVLIISFKSSRQGGSCSTRVDPSTSKEILKEEKEKPIPPLIFIEEQKDETWHMALLLRNDTLGQRTDSDGKIWIRKKRKILKPRLVISSILQHHQTRNLLLLHHPGLRYPHSH